MKRLDLENEFKNPSSQYRSIPFWAWNDMLEIDEIRRQIREMKACGIGGFFMHSRDGLETEYLSGEWFECIKAAVEEAKANDMYAWLYDEDRWPSGSCGGRVSKDGNGCKGLTLEVCDIIPDGEALTLYAAVINDMDIYSLRRINKDDEICDGEKVLVIRLEESEGSEWFNYSPPPDNLSSNAVAEFIESTHERYKECVGEEFGKAICGIFTDEPSLADRHAAFNPNRGWIPWTYGFENYYKSRRNGDIFDMLPYIYFNHEKSRKARHDYWRTVSELFLENYSGQISKWCRENNIAYTGHFLQEDKLGLCCRVSGGVMPHYAMQDVPAIDLLTERREEYITVKQCTSVANQFGKDTVLSEMYGCTGWDFSFEGQKHIGEWQYVMGVNRRCQHLALYSLRGCRKRDYPPSINCNAPWWKHYKVVEDYFARIGYVLSSTKAVQDVLLIHPMSTVWSNVGCNPYGNPVRKNERDVPAMNELGNRLNELIKGLHQKHYNCDLGDEVLIAGHGSVKGGKFAVGECSYSTVIIPFCETLLDTTVELLIEFMNQGGKVVSIAPHTHYLQGETSDKIDKLTGHCRYITVESEEELFEYLRANVKPMVSLTDDSGEEASGVLYQLRRAEDGYILYIVNDSVPQRINIDLRKNIYRLNPMDGQVTQCDNEKGFSDYLLQYGSSLFYISDREIECDAEVRIKTDGTDLPIKSMGYNTDTPNVLTLDKCRYILDLEKSDLMEIWKAQYEVREKLGMRQIYLNGIEQRYRWINLPHENNGKELVMEIPFTSLCEVKGAQLVIERPECFDIKFDGEKVDNSICGYFFDKAFKTIKLPLIGAGEHVLTLKCCYRNDFELENCYIIGEFGVDTERKITLKPECPELGDIGNQGFYHYAGEIEYRFECDIPDVKDEIYLDVSEFDGICASAEVNGKEFAVPWRAEGILRIGKYLDSGKNEITVKVCTGFRNMLGPLHITNKPLVTKDSLFAPTGENYTEEYITEKAGLRKVRLFY